MSRWALLCALGSSALLLSQNISMALINDRISFTLEPTARNHHRTPPAYSGYPLDSAPLSTSLLSCTSRNAPCPHTGLEASQISQSVHTTHQPQNSHRIDNDKTLHEPKTATAHYTLALNDTRQRVNFVYHLSTLWNVPQLKLFPPAQCPTTRKSTQILAS